MVDLYEKYKSLFEEKIEGFIERQGFTVDDFYDVLRSKTESGEYIEVLSIYC